MDDVLAALHEQQDELAGLLSGLAPEAWRAPSPCEGWDVADVVLHLAQTNELAVASARGEFGERLSSWTSGMSGAADVDEGAARLVERERDASIDEIHERWQRSVVDLRDALGAVDPHERVQWVAGTLSAQTLATTRLAETWIHTTDVAEAIGATLDPSPRLRHVARLAWRTVPYAFARDERTLHGPVAFHLHGPDGAAWTFEPDEPAVTTVRGDGIELCLVAARRMPPGDTTLEVDGPDGEAVLDLVRTYA